jgi:hypothetical protein
VTDRELLELAAKAASYETNTDGRDFWLAADGESIKHWNPLTDDGDALRLAVKLRIDLFNYGGPPIHHAPHVDAVHMDGFSHGSASEDVCSDPYAATRRAIVRAAAEIGRAMP